jgi:hypothetical protein
MEIHALEVDKQTNKQTIEQKDISNADKTTKLQQEVLCITHKNC